MVRFKMWPRRGHPKGGPYSLGSQDRHTMEAPPLGVSGRSPSCPKGYEYQEKVSLYISIFFICKVDMCHKPLCFCCSRSTLVYMAASVEPVQMVFVMVKAGTTSTGALACYC